MIQLAPITAAFVSGILATLVAFFQYDEWRSRQREKARGPKLSPDMLISHVDGIFGAEVTLPAPTTVDVLVRHMLGACGKRASMTGFDKLNVTDKDIAIELRWQVRVMRRLNG